MKNESTLLSFVEMLESLADELGKQNDGESQAVICARSNAVHSIKIRIQDLKEELTYLEENEDVDGIELFEDKINSILSVFEEEYGDSDFEQEYAKEIERISNKLRDIIS